MKIFRYIQEFINTNLLPNSKEEKHKQSLSLTVTSYPTYTPVLHRAIELWYHDPSVTTPVLKLMAELAQNRYGMLSLFFLSLSHIFTFIPVLKKCLLAEYWHSA